MLFIIALSVLIIRDILLKSKKLEHYKSTINISIIGILIILVAPWLIEFYAKWIVGIPMETSDRYAMLAGLIGGIFAIIGLAVTLNVEKNKTRTELKIQYRPYLVMKAFTQNFSFDGINGDSEYEQRKLNFPLENIGRGEATKIKVIIKSVEIVFAVPVVSNGTIVFHKHAENSTTSGNDLKSKIITQNIEEFFKLDSSNFPIIIHPDKSSYIEVIINEPKLQEFIELAEGWRKAPKPSNLSDEEVSHYLINNIRHSVKKPLLRGCKFELRIEYCGFNNEFHNMKLKAHLFRDSQESDDKTGWSSSQLMYRFDNISLEEYLVDNEKI